jgi:hypothetical protein
MTAIYINDGDYSLDIYKLGVIPSEFNNRSTNDLIPNISQIPYLNIKNSDFQFNISKLGVIPSEFNNRSTNDLIPNISQIPYLNIKNSDFQFNISKLGVIPSESTNNVVHEQLQIPYLNITDGKFQLNVSILGFTSIGTNNTLLISGNNVDRPMNRETNPIGLNTQLFGIILINDANKLVNMLILITDGILIHKFLVAHPNAMASIVQYDPNGFLRNGPKCILTHKKNNQTVSITKYTSHEPKNSNHISMKKIPTNSNHISMKKIPKNGIMFDPFRTKKYGGPILLSRYNHLNTSFLSPTRPRLIHHIN